MTSALRFIALFMLVSLCGHPAVAAETVRTVRIAGKEYARLGDWARKHDFATRWVERDKLLELKNRNGQLIFTLDANRDRRVVKIDGVSVVLAFPAVYDKGIAYVSQLDLTKTIEPVVFPRKASSASKVETICLDPGHGGKDPGFRVGSHQEQKYALLLAEEVRDQLQRAGFKVVMTRTSNRFVDLPTRPEIARKSGADLFVSLHFNAVSQSASRVQGIEVYCCTPAGASSSNTRGQGSTGWVRGNQNNDRSMLLAYQVQKAMVKKLSAEDRGVKRARFSVLRDATMPAILVEGGFMSHPAESRKIFDPAYRRQMATAIVEGIVAYKRAING